MVHGGALSSDPKRKWIRALGAMGWIALVGGSLVYLTQAIHNPKESQQSVVPNKRPTVQEKPEVIKSIPYLENKTAPSTGPEPPLFFYQVGAFSDEIGAKAVQKRLMQFGLPVRLVLGKKAKPLVRVIVGPLKPEQLKWLKTQGFQPIIYEDPI